MKKVLFIILLPVYAPLSLFLNHTLGWWEGLLD